MAVSYNGFQASTNKALIDVRDYTLPGTTVTFPAGIASWAAPLLLWAAGEWHRTIEPVRAGWCWGYFYRVTTGGTTLSNHASGTAIDVNAPLHPYGVGQTFTATQRQNLANILTQANKYGTVLVSGEFYRGVPDGMHLEIATGATKAQVIAAGDRLTRPADWFDDMATREDLRAVVDNALAAALNENNPALMNAIRVAITAERDQDAQAVVNNVVEKLAADTPLRAAFRSNVRTPVDAELTQRGLGT